MYNNQLKNITNTQDPVYKTIDKTHLVDIAVYFRGMKTSQFDKVTYSTIIITQI